MILLTDYSIRLVEWEVWVWACFTRWLLVQGLSPLNTIAASITQSQFVLYFLIYKVLLTVVTTQ